MSIGAILIRSLLLLLMLLPVLQLAISEQNDSLDNSAAFNRLIGGKKQYLLTEISIPEQYENWLESLSKGG